MQNDIELYILSGEHNSIDSDFSELHKIVVDGPSGLSFVHKDGVLTITSSAKPLNPAS